MARLGNAQTQFASNLPQPLHCYKRPPLYQMEHELSSHKHQGKQSLHALNSLHSHVFHVQALLLVEAGAFEAAAGFAAAAVTLVAIFWPFSTR